MAEQWTSKVDGLGYETRTVTGRVRMPLASKVNPICGAAAPGR